MTLKHAISKTLTFGRSSRAQVDPSNSPVSSPPPSTSKPTDTPAPLSVTELALLKVPISSAWSAAYRNLPPDVGAPNPSDSVFERLRHATKAMEKVSAGPFAWYMLYEIGDPMPTDLIEPGNVDVLLIGGWPSISYHMDTWIPSPENRAVVEYVGAKDIKTRWMWHMDVPRDAVQKVLDNIESPQDLQAQRLRFWRGIFKPEPDTSRETGASNMVVDRDPTRILADLHATIGDGVLVWSVRADKGIWGDGEVDARDRLGEQATELVVLAVKDDSEQNRDQQEAVDIALGLLSALAEEKVELYGTFLRRL